MPITIHQARKAKAALAKHLEGTKELVGLGLTKQGEDYAVKVNLSSRPRRKLPDSVGGVPVCIEITGKIRKHD